MLYFITKPRLGSFGLFDLLCAVISFLGIYLSEWGIVGMFVWIIGSTAIHTYTAFSLREIVNAA